MAGGLVYPTGGEYRDALYNTRLCFKDPALRSATAVADAQGMPRPVSGNFASVFTLEGDNGRRWAVKCFTKAVDDRAGRYEAISDALASARSSWQVAFEYLPEGILCRGTWFPVVKMEWIEARPLIPYIEENLWQPEKLSRLAAGFARIVDDLAERGIAHGDLQHGNLLITPAGEAKLVDYDGMFVPSLVSAGATEKGHANYQSPLRTLSHWGAHLDNFSAWVIYTSLLALTLDPSLWIRLHGDGDEALLFHQADFEDRAAAPALLALSQASADPVRLLASAWDALYVGRLEDIPRLDSAALPLPSASAVAAGGGSISGEATSTIPGVLPEWLLQAIDGPTPSPPDLGAGATSWLTDHVPSTPPVQLDRPGRVVRTTARALVLVALLSLASSAASHSPGGAAPTAVLFLLLALAACGAGYHRNPRVKERRQRERQRQEAAHARRAFAKDAERASARRADVVASLHSREQSDGAQFEASKASEAAELRASQEQLRDRLSEIARRKQHLQQAMQGDLANALRSAQEDHVRQRLQSMTVARASLEGFGPRLLDALRGSGIVSAADFRGVAYQDRVYVRLTNGQLVYVRGVGEKKAVTLEAWRRDCERFARASQPSSLPSPVAQQIRSRYQDQLQRLDNEERTLQHTHRSEQAAVSRKWADQRARLQAGVEAARRDVMTQLANADAELTEARKQLARADWKLGTAQRDCNAYAGISYRKYVVRAVWR